MPFGPHGLSAIWEWSPAQRSTQAPLWEQVIYKVERCVYNGVINDYYLMGQLTVFGVYKG